MDEAKLVAAGVSETAARAVMDAMQCQRWDATAAELLQRLPPDVRAWKPADVDVWARCVVLLDDDDVVALRERQLSGAMLHCMAYLAADVGLSASAVARIAHTIRKAKFEPDQTAQVDPTVIPDSAAQRLLDWTTDDVARWASDVVALDADDVGKLEDGGVDGAGLDGPLDALGLSASGLRRLQWFHERGWWLTPARKVPEFAFLRTSRVLISITVAFSARACRFRLS